MTNKEKINYIKNHSLKNYWEYLRDHNPPYEQPYVRFCIGGHYYYLRYSDAVVVTNNFHDLSHSNTDIKKGANK